MRKERVLVVEDEPIIAGFIDHTLSRHHLHILCVESAEEAWRQLIRPDHGFGAILLDRQLPGLDGLALLRQIKETDALRHIPIILETAQNDPESIREGLAAGAFYYLTKPLQPKLLLAVVDAALSDFREWVQMRASLAEAARALDFLETGTFRYRTLTEARELAQCLARLCPDPGRVALGLQELLVNAVEHGNLDIGYAEKTHLLLEGIWEDEVQRRQADPRFRERSAQVQLQRAADRIEFEIRDQGKGFDWPGYLDFDPERATDPHGRGIAMARMMSFDGMEYVAPGNRVRVMVALPDR